MYLRPASERAAEFRRRLTPDAAPPAPAGHDWTKGLPPRAAFVAEQLGRQSEGGQAGPLKTAEQWGAAWDRMKAKLDGARGK